MTAITVYSSTIVFWVVFSISETFSADFYEL